MEALNRPALDIGVAAYTLTGEEQCGDLHIAASFPGGILAAVVDGIGHGPEAAKAAKAVEDVLKSGASDSLALLIKYCHERLRGTRGAVMSLAAFDYHEKTMVWTGIGNVQGTFLSMDPLSTPQTLLSSVGTLGYQFASIYPTKLAINPGDTLILATDGIRVDFDHQLNLRQSPQELADHILDRYAHRTDDALVLVGRYLE